jgi:hypothetical protein
MVDRSYLEIPHVDMNVPSSGNVPLHRRSSSVGEDLVKRRANWTTAVLVSVTLGVLSGIIGLVINTLLLLRIVQNTRVIGLLGTGLTVAAFTLLMLSAHCLDKTGEIEKAISVENYRQRVLKEKDR